MKRFGLGGITDDMYPRILKFGKHDITNILDHCTAHTTLRQRHHINGIMDQWNNPSVRIAYLQSTGLFDTKGSRIKQQ